LGKVATFGLSARRTGILPGLCYLNSRVLCPIKERKAATSGVALSCKIIQALRIRSSGVDFLDLGKVATLGHSARRTGVRSGVSELNSRALCPIKEWEAVTSEVPFVCKIIQIPRIGSPGLISSIWESCDFWTLGDWGRLRRFQPKFCILSEPNSVYPRICWVKSHGVQAGKLLARRSSLG